MVINSDGNVGIGTASPSAKLTINSTGTANPGENGIYVYNPTYQSGDAIITARVNGTGGDPFISFDIADVLGWTFGIDSSDAGKLKWGATWDSLTNNTKMTLDMSGNLTILGAYGNSSDDRLKENETRIENALLTICKLDPQTYDKRPDLESNVFTYEAGLIAQDIYYDVPELRYLVHVPSDATPSETKPESGSDIQVDPDYSDWGTTPASVNYIGLIPYLIKSIQELKDENDALKARVTALES